ncbi:MAG: hypothetical protein ABI665_05315 [Vicinamibacterales bacterium]
MLAALAASCSKNSPTSPTATTTTPTSTVAAVPAYDEQFVGKVAGGGSSFYSFTVTQYGTVNITLTNVDGAFVPSTVTVGLGIGVPSGEGCATSTTVSTKAGATAQLTGTYDAGVYCAEVFDVGNLYAPANFAVTISYP